MNRRWTTFGTFLLGLSIVTHLAAAAHAPPQPPQVPGAFRRQVALVPIDVPFYG